MRLWACVAALAALLLPGVAYADEAYPAGPIRMVVPFPAGGSTDAVARAIAQKLNEDWGKPIVVENRPGAGGTLGSAQVAKAAPDGYTVLIGTVSTHAVALSLYEKLPYHPLKDFAPITEIANTPNVLVVNPSVPAKTFAELVALAKQKPGALSFASNGNGTSNHLAGELFKTMTGVDVLHVPYKGGNPALLDTLAGQTSMMFDTISTSLPHIQAGKLRPLGVTSLTRSPVLPDVPTIAEAGLPGYEAIVWFGLLAPAGTPTSVVDKLNGGVAKALQNEQIRSLLASQGAAPVGSKPDEFVRMIEKDIARWAEVVKVSGARAD